MYIKKLTIKEYGSLRDREFSLCDGINLFEGNNESGKSTVLSFIRFILYGMPRRSGGDKVSEKDRGLSWASGVAEGSMEITVGDKAYRIERRGALHGDAKDYIEKSSIIDLGTGTEVFVGEVPGKLFLGIPAEVFTCTACIRQLECSIINGDDVNESIRNLLFAADEEIDTGKVLGKFDEMRRGLLYKNGKGGRIYELESTRDRLTERLRKAKIDSEVIISKEASAERMKAVEEKTRRAAEEAEEQIRVYEAATTLLRFEKLHTYEEQTSAHEQALENLCREKGYKNALPDRETLGVIDRYKRGLADAIAENGYAETDLGRAKEAPTGDRDLAGFHNVITEAGGEPMILGEFLIRKKQKKNALVRTILFFILGALLVGGGAFALVSGILDSILPSFAPYILFGVGGLLVILGIVSMFSVSKATKQIRELFAKIGSNDSSMEEKSLIAHIEVCRQNHETGAAYDEAVSRLTSILNVRHTALEKNVTGAKRLLESLGESGEDKSPDDLVAALDALYDRLFDICTEKEQIESALSASRKLVDELTIELARHNEASLLASIGNRVPSELVGSTDIDKLRLTYNYNRTQHSACESKRIAVEKELIAISSTAESPARVSAMLEDTERELAVCREQYEAISMAIDTLEASCADLQKNVSPRLRVRAGEIMDKLTAGRYHDLGVSENMDITVLAEGSTRPIDAMSKGTRDAAYLALRLALVELICAKEPSPLIFDESFTQFDDKRVTNILNMLFNSSLGGTQAILFTCHRREGEILRHIGNFNDIILEK